MTNTTDTEDKAPLSFRLFDRLYGDFKEVDKAMLLAGKTDEEIAKRFGVSRGTVINHRRRLGYRTVRTIADDR